MPNSTAEAQTSVEIGKTNILDQRRRIERQRGLIARLESEVRLIWWPKRFGSSAKWSKRSLRWRSTTPPRGPAARGFGR